MRLATFDADQRPRRSAVGRTKRFKGEVVGARGPGIAVDKAGVIHPAPAVGAGITVSRLECPRPRRGNQAEADGWFRP